MASRRTLDVNIPHQLGREAARQRLANRVAEFEQGKGLNGLAQVRHQWAGDQMNFEFTAMGQKATGRINVLDDVLKLSIDLPWFLAALADKLRPKIEEEGRRMLEKK
jgi:hypothetical protein